MSLTLSIRNKAVLFFFAASALSVTPSPAQQQPPTFVQVAEDFSRGSGGWLAEFTDYGLTQGGLRRLAEIRPLPEETGVQGYGYFLQGMNGSDDLFSFLKKPLELEDGIEPGASYEVEFLIEFASNAPTGCPGAGGSPGDSVYLKVGVSNVEPVPLLGPEGLRINLDKGNQSEDGDDATSAGTVANGLECTAENERYVLIERRQAHKSRVTASDEGRLWLFVGTDSGYEGLNQLYYARIVASLTRVEGGAR